MSPEVEVEGGILEPFVVCIVNGKFNARKVLVPVSLSGANVVSYHVLHNSVHALSLPIGSRVIGSTEALLDVPDFAEGGEKVGGKLSSSVSHKGPW